MVKILRQASGNNWAAFNGDCVEAIAGIPDNSIHYNIESPPFSSLFSYSSSARDMGNSRNDQEFYEHFCFLVREKFRVMKPGRLVSQHCMNLPTAKWMHGYIGLRDFRGELIRIFINDDAADLYAAMRKLGLRRLQSLESGDTGRALKLEDTIAVIDEELQSHPGDSGFIYHSEVAIWKDPVMAQQRTNAIGLLHKQLVKDSSMSRQGLADYLVTFRKPGDNPEPIAGMLADYYGTEFSSEESQSLIAKSYNSELLSYNKWQTMTDEEKSNYREFYGGSEMGYDAEWQMKPPSVSRYEQNQSIEIWQRYASPVWNDINPNDTLNGDRGKKRAREDEDTKHICPLQLTVIRRAIQLWSNPGDVVLTNFGGIGSEGYVAVEMGRKAVLMELKGAYFDELVKNMRHIAGDDSQQMNLMDLIAAS